MSRDLDDEDYYMSQGGMIPIKWTAPEVIKSTVSKYVINIKAPLLLSVLSLSRLSTSGSTPQRVMCGALVYWCMRCGALDTHHLEVRHLMR